MNGKIVRKLEQKAIRFPTASTANCLLPDHSSFIVKPAPDSAYILLKAGRDTRGTPASNDISVDVKDVICCR